MHSSSIPSSLLLRLQANDQEAWRRLVELYGPVVYKRCRKGGVPARDAGDVGQGVFNTAYRSIAGFRRASPGDSFRGWLSRLIQRRVADYHRRRQRVVEGEPRGGSDAQRVLVEAPGEEIQPSSGLDGRPDPGAPPTDPDPAETNELVRRALRLIRENFERKTWDVVWLVVMRRVPVEDVATQAGMSVNAVRIAKTRVIQRLREEFGDLLGLSPEWGDE
jgi:RNA polymerase sigma-70 factor (ECF subfamily)